MQRDELVNFAKENRHAFEIIVTSRKRKFYLDFDNDAPDDGMPPEDHQRAIVELQAKAIADAERLCGPGHAVLSGSWAKKGDHIRYSLHLVRPDRYFPDHSAMLNMPVIAKSIGADPNVYKRNQLMKLPVQSKLKDDRIQGIISGELREHIVTAFFAENAAPVHMEVQSAAAVVAAPPPRARSELSATRRAAALGPWDDTAPDISDNSAMTSPPLETLFLIRHTTEAPHRLPRAVRYMVMGWCRARGVAEEAYYAWVFQGKEDTPDRRARYGADWRRWENKRLPGDRKILLVF
jgi:hypothetical protein